MGTLIVVLLLFGLQGYTIYHSLRSVKNPLDHESYDMRLVADDARIQSEYYLQSL